MNPSGMKPVTYQLVVQHCASTKCVTTYPMLRSNVHNTSEYVWMLQYHYRFLVLCYLPFNIKSPNT